MSTKANNRILLVILLVIVALIGMSVFVRVNSNKKSAQYYLPEKLKIDGTVLKSPRIISQFHMTSDSGKAFTKKDLKGHWTLMFFGFTNCGYVCPTTLSELNKMDIQLRAALPARLLPKVVMVSVDPERDSAKRMHDYVSSFNKNFIGLRGTMQQTKILTQQMSVVFAKLKMDNGNYSVNHSAEMMVLDPNGNLRAFMSYPHKADQMARDYEAMMHALKPTS